MWARAKRAEPRLAAFALAALAGLALSAAPAEATGRVPSARALDHWARQYILAKVADRHPQAVEATCRRHGSARARRRAHWNCTWRGSKPLREHEVRRCRGRSRVSYTAPRRWRSRLVRRRCTVDPVEPPATPFFGFSDNSWLDPSFGIDAPTEADLVARAGATGHRVFFDWRYAERERDRYVEANFAHYTRMYEALLARGIRPLITVAFAPSWAWEPLTWCSGEQCRFPPGRLMNDEWAEIVTELARRYPAAAGIEIWNEPNIDTFWRSPDPTRYAELVAIAHDAIKRVDPAIRVIGGALGNVPSPPPAGDIPTEEFLDRAYRAGMGGKIDALSLHAYPYGPDLGPQSIFRAPFEAVRRVLARHGDGDRRLWVTEVGVSTSDARPGRTFDESQQASILLAIRRELAATPDVDALFIHALVDKPRFPEGDQERGYGVMRATQPPTPKRAYCQLVRIAAGARPGC